MKVLIVFTTKAGTTEECANHLFEKIKGDTTIVNLNKQSKVDVNAYDAIIIGTPIYAGMINKKVKQFCNRYEQELLAKKLYFYTCGLSEPDEALAALSKQISNDLKEAAISITHFGGDMRLDRLKGFTKFIAKLMTKDKKISSTINDKEIDNLASKINKECKSEEV